MAQSDSAGHFGKVPEPVTKLKPRSAAVVYAHLSARYGGLKAIFPSGPTLATALGCSVDTVQRSIKTLEQAGWLLVIRKPGLPKSTSWPRPRPRPPDTARRWKAAGQGRK